MIDEKKAKKVGVITHYYPNLSVGIVKLDKQVKIGDTIYFKGHTTDFEQLLDDMQYDHKEIEEGKKGQEGGIKVSEKVREGDYMYVLEK